MARLSVAIIVTALMMVLVTAGGAKHAIQKRNGMQITTYADVYQWICQVSGNGYTFCSVNTPATTKGTTSTATTAATTTLTSRGQPGGVPDSAVDQTTTTTTTTTSTSTQQSSTTSTSSSTPSALELAHWCQYAANGSWLPFNYTFMHTPCIMCHCGADRNVSCNELQCMDLHCIDGTVPVNITDQCCPQCAYQVASTSCRSNGLTFPDGTRITTLNDDVECWCQSGSIECRKIVTAASTTTTTVATIAVVYTSYSSYLPSGTTAYVVIVVICLVLMLGTLLCCGCALLYYYYYQNQQQNVQQAYEQYYNSAGWQPMGADGQVDGVTGEEKEAEAAQQAAAAAHYPTGQSSQYVPPPYAVFNGPYEPKHQELKQV